MRTGIATIPLDTGKCPKWLFERMKKLSRIVTLAVVEEFGPQEFIKRLADPVWFQSFGCVIGFDWNSSGLTTTTTGALKEGLRDIEKELGIFICGGKGKISRKTPDQIVLKANNTDLPQKAIDNLVFSSKMSAKVDSCLLQDGFQIYHHTFIFDKYGNWTVIQQGMNTFAQKARRYHWSSLKIISFDENPHSGVFSEFSQNKALNLLDIKSRDNKKAIIYSVNNENSKILKVLETSIVARTKNITLLDINSRDFKYHPILEEKFNIKTLKEKFEKLKMVSPNDIVSLLATENIGPKTIRALSLVCDIIYGAKPSFEDPFKFSFAHGGKDGIPYPVDRPVFDKTIEFMEKVINRAKTSAVEKNRMRSSLVKMFNN